MIKANDIIEDPTYLAYRFDFDNEAVEFIPVDEDDLERAAWLKRDALSSARAPIIIPLPQLIDTLASITRFERPKQTNFIFHTAYCASTFLSRCLAVNNVSVSLREPQLLLDAANAKRLQWRSRSLDFDFKQFPALALRLLQKHALPHQSLIIKPINSVNNIIPELLQASGQAKSLMLYTDARNFLLSTLKKGEGAKQTGRAMFDLLRCDFPHLSNLRLTDVIHMSDLKLILTLWRLQLEQAERLLKSSAISGRMASLYSEGLVNEPLKSLQAVSQFLDLGISASTIEDIASSDLRFADAKNTHESFNKQKREERYKIIESFHGVDIENSYQWLINNNQRTSLNPILSNALGL